MKIKIVDIRYGHIHFVDITRITKNYIFVTYVNITGKTIKDRINKKHGYLVSDKNKIMVK